MRIFLIQESVKLPRRMFLTLPKDYWYDNLSGIGTFNHLKRLGEDSFR